MMRNMGVSMLYCEQCKKKIFENTYTKEGILYFCSENCCDIWFYDPADDAIDEEW